MSARVEECRYQGAPGLSLHAGELAVTFLPTVGMTGVSLRYRGSEHLAVPGGVAALKRGATGGLPLLAPWANRLSGRRYRAAGVNVDFSGLAVPTDENGLPIHGLLLGKSGWSIRRSGARAESAFLHASIDVDSPAFPFPHRIEVTVRARPNQLQVITTLVPTGKRRVPAAFGWHPYLQLPHSPRRTWTLRLPRRRRLELDERGIPTGAAEAEPAEAAPIGRRTFDDLYTLGRDRALAFEAENGAAIELRCGDGYPYSQVWVPTRRAFGALEPMTAPTNALVDGQPRLVDRGDAFSARFTITLRAPNRDAQRSP